MNGSATVLVISAARNAGSSHRRPPTASVLKGRRVGIERRIGNKGAPRGDSRVATRRNHKYGESKCQAETTSSSCWPRASQLATPNPARPPASPSRPRDSAGVRIAEYTGTPVAGAPFRFPAGPRYRRGANPGGCAFRGIHPGSLFPDGRAVISDVFNEEPVVLSQDGTTHELLAGPGEGPGDASYGGAVFALGQDRVLAADRELGRAAILRRRFGVSARWTSGAQTASASWESGSSGQLLMATNSFMPGFEEDWLPGHMARFDMDTGALDTVASYDLLSRPPPGLRRSPAGAGGMVTSRPPASSSARVPAGRRSPGACPAAPWTQIVRWQAGPEPLAGELPGGHQGRTPGGQPGWPARERRMPTSSA